MSTFETTPPMPLRSDKSGKTKSSLGDAHVATPGDSSEAKLRSLILRHLTSTLARHPGAATPRDWWVATALATRDHIHERMIETQSVHNDDNVRRLYYFSMEYLMGRLFESNLLATGLTADAQAALERIAHACPVHQSLSPDVDLPIVFHWTE